MITYEPFWDYLDWHEISTYTLITKHHVSSSTINRLRHSQHSDNRQALRNSEMPGR